MNRYKTLVWLITMMFAFSGVSAQNPVISDFIYENITTNSVTLNWNTDIPADSRVFWMAPDSNYQPLVFTDSLDSTEKVTLHTIRVNNLIPATIYKFRLISSNLDGTAIDSGYFVTQSESGGKVGVYFNHSVDTSVSDGTPANGNQSFETLIDTYINQSKYSIDITLWEFSGINSVASALIKAKDRGVRIRFIYNHTADTPLIDSLRAHDIPVLKRNFDITASMHNKFWIFDHRYNPDPGNQYLWTGSANVSHAQFHQDRNNIIIVQDQSLCAVYTREFEEMWGSHTDLPDVSRARFGPQKIDNVPHILNVGGKRMEVYFSPSDTILPALTHLILNQPQKSLFFCMYKFILPPLEEVLHSVFKDGIQVSGVFDSSNSVRKGSAFPRMKGEDVDSAWNPHADVFIDTITGLLHHKYFLTDADTQSENRIIVTGSFNWETPAVTDNDENFLILYDPVVNNQYFQEWTARYKESGGSLVGSGFRKLPENNSSASGIMNIYPNPCTSEVTFILGIAEHSTVSVELSDCLGHTTLIFAEHLQYPGNYEIGLDTSVLPAGLYLVRMKAGRQVCCKMMMVKK